MQGRLFKNNDSFIDLNGPLGNWNQLVWSSCAVLTLLQRLQQGIMQQSLFLTVQLFSSLGDWYCEHWYVMVPCVFLWISTTCLILGTVKSLTSGNMLLYSQRAPELYWLCIRSGLFGLLVIKFFTPWCKTHYDIQCFPTDHFVFFSCLYYLCPVIVTQWTRACFKVTTWILYSQDYTSPSLGSKFLFTKVSFPFKISVSNP